MPLSARVAPLPGVFALQPSGPIAQALRDELAARPDADPDVEAFYAARGWRPLWVEGWRLRPEAQSVLAHVRAARDDGLEASAYRPRALARAIAAAVSGTPESLAHAELLTSEAFAGWASDLHRPKPGADMVYADPAVAPLRFDRRGALVFIARSASKAQAIDTIAAMNPIYEGLRAALKAARAAGAPMPDRELIRANLERARALPVDLGGRYILVDAAAQTLWMYQDGRPVGSMPVVVGKVSEPTPAMAGVVRFAVARPYWNVPPDLTRDKYAPAVLQNGPGVLAAQHLQVLSDWTDQAVRVDPSAVDWLAVEAGQETPHLRQDPGPQNMMGKVKFVFPNGLGVYLHDTPLRNYFAEHRRTESSGCVRLYDAPRLARWLLGDQATEIDRQGAPETRIDLRTPVPVYIVYFTELPTAQGLQKRADFYGRDPRIIASLDTASANVANGAS